MSKIDIALLKKLVEKGKIKQETLDIALEAMSEGVQKDIIPEAGYRQIRSEKNPNKFVTQIPDDVPVLKNVAEIRDNLDNPKTRGFAESMRARFGENPPKELEKAIQMAMASDQPYANVGKSGGPIPTFGNDGFMISRAGQEIGHPGLMEPFNSKFIDPLPWMDQKYGVTKRALEEARDNGLPVTLNTSSDLIGHDDYIAALPKGSKVRLYAPPAGKDNLNRDAFPGSPSRARIDSAFKKLKSSGVDVELIETTPDDVAAAISRQTQGNSKLKFGNPKDRDQLIAEYRKVEPTQAEAAGFKVLDGEGLGSGIPEADLKRMKAGVIAPAAGMGMQGFESPLQMMKPAAEAYSQGKEAAANALAGQLDLTKDKSAAGDMSQALQFTLDPLNFVSGAAGLGGAAVEGMLNMTPSKKKLPIDATQAQALYKGGLIKDDTLQMVRGFAQGGIVPDSLSPQPSIYENPLVPDVATMQAPQVNYVSQEEKNRALLENIKAPTFALIPPPTPEQIQADRMQEGLAGNAYPTQEPQMELIRAPQGPNQMEMHNQAMAQVNPYFDQYESAIRDSTVLAQKQAGANSAYANQAAQIIQDRDDQLMQLRAAQNVEWDKQKQGLEQAVAGVTGSKIDPNRFWADKSTGSRIGMAISMFFSGLNGSNAGIQILNSAIDRDIEAQRADLLTKREGVQMQRGLLSDMMEKFGDERQAIAAAKVSALELAQIKLQAQAATVTGQNAILEARKGLAALGVQKMEAVQKFKEATMLSGAYLNQNNIVGKIMAQPKELRGQLMEEKKAYDAAEAANKTIDTVYRDLSEKASFSKQIISPLAASTEKKTATAKLYPYARIIAGPGSFTDSDFDRILEPFLPTSYDDAGTKAQKKKAFQQAVLSNSAPNFKTMIDLGIVSPISSGGFSEGAPVSSRKGK
jgi:hypothetical protein